MIDPARLAPLPGNPPVRALMRDEVVFCLPSTPIDALAKLMADNDLSELPVLIDRRPVGYVRSRDIVEQYVEGGIEIGGSDVMRSRVTSVLARDILRTPPLLVDENAPVEEVFALLRDRNRSLALVMHEDELPVGMLTPREVAAHLADRLALEVVR